MAEAKRNIAVLGGGASGIAAAICAARAGARVTLYEATGRVAQSIKITGDGRCNIANAGTSADVYRNAAFVGRAFESCPPAQSIEFLESCGLLLREEAEGRLYPQANKSTSVIDSLRCAAQHAGVREITGKRAQVVSPKDGHWQVRFADTSKIEADAVIVCCGHHLPDNLLPSAVCVAPFRPLLGPISCDTAPIRGLDKMRVKCALTLQREGEAPMREKGEVTFRAYGMSGIAAFNMSRIAQRGDVITVDFLADFEADQSLDYLRKRLARIEASTWEEFLYGALLPLVARVVLLRAGLNIDARPDEDGLPKLDAALRAFPLTVRGIGDKRLCQVQRGGVDVSAVGASTMQLTGCPDLFVTGEALDVDAPCGGYNLQWAWASGIIAGCAAGQSTVAAALAPHASV